MGVDFDHWSLLRTQTSYAFVSEQVYTEGNPLYTSADNEEDIITEVNSRNSKHLLLDIEDQICLAVCVYRSYSATLS